MTALGCAAIVVAAVVVGELYRQWRHAAGQRIENARQNERQIESAAVLYLCLAVEGAACPGVVDLLHEGVLDARRPDLARCTTKCSGADEPFPIVTAHCAP